MFNPPPAGPEPQVQVTGPRPMSPEGLLRAFQFAADQFEEGVSTAEVRQQLRAAGLDREAAEGVLQHVLGMTPAKRRLTNWVAPAQHLALFAAHRQAARSNIALGGLICGIGVVVTVGTFLAASASRAAGGVVIVAWGAILFGGIRLMSGLSQLSKCR